MERSPYASGRMVLRPGDDLLLYTDGVTEAMDLGQTLYSDERLEQFLANESQLGSAPDHWRFGQRCKAFRWRSAAIG